LKNLSRQKNNKETLANNIIAKKKKNGTPHLNSTLYASKLFMTGGLAPVDFWRWSVTEVIVCATVHYCYYLLSYLLYFFLPAQQIDTINMGGLFSSKKHDEKKSRENAVNAWSSDGAGARPGAAAESADRVLNANPEETLFVRDKLWEYFRDGKGVSKEELCERMDANIVYELYFKQLLQVSDTLSSDK
jgi:hypothetical protein